jgi:hypothetical protein
MQDAEVRMSPLLHKLHLDDHTLGEIMRTFQKIDRVHNKQLSLNEFLNFYGLEETYFAKMIFSRMDYGHKGSLDFEEYVSCVMLCCFSLVIVVDRCCTTAMHDCPCWCT